MLGKEKEGVDSRGSRQTQREATMPGRAEHIHDLMSMLKAAGEAGKPDPVAALDP